MPPPPGAKLTDVQELVGRIEKLVAGGEGLARFEGVTIFVPRSAPGDRLRIKITERKPDYGRAEIVEILEPGPDRRPDPVPELSLTGVCDLQHLHEAAQSRLKAEAVRETLEHIGKFTLPPDTPVITGEPWGYRLHTQIHTDIDPVAGGVQVGYHARGTNTVIPVSRCPLLVPELEALLAELPAVLGPDAPRRLDLAAGDGGEVTVSPVVEGLPHGEVSTRVGDFTYSYDARCFFQSHRGLLPKLIELAVGPWEGDTALDLYAGVGLFSLPLSRKYRRVIAVEADQIGSRFGRMNVKRNRVDNIEMVNQVVESWITGSPPRWAACCWTRPGVGSRCAPGASSRGSPRPGSPTSLATPPPWPAICARSRMCSRWRASRWSTCSPRRGTWRWWCRWCGKRRGRGQISITAPPPGHKCPG